MYLYQGDCLFKGNLQQLKKRCAYRIFSLRHDCASDFVDEVGVVRVSREGNWTTLKVENQQVADRFIRKCLRNKITDFRCETVALQDLIREALDGRAC